MSSMIAVENYDAEYIDEKTHDWYPCRVIGVIKGDQTPQLEFVILVTKLGKQKLKRVESISLPDDD